MEELRFLGTESNYENVRGDCPNCDRSISINRATSLENRMPALGGLATCPSCGCSLRIAFDTGNHPVDLLLFQIRPLKEEQSYVQCILALAQALEITLAECIQHIFVSVPCSESIEASAQCVEIDAELHSRMKKMTLEPLRNLTMKIGLHGLRPATVDETREWIPELNNLAKDAPSAAALERIPTSELRECMLELREVTIGSLRNDVAHHVGRRPTLADVEKHEEQVSSVVRKLLRVFGLTPRGGQLVLPPDR